MSYKVYSVDGADRMTLMGPTVHGQPTFKQISLSFIQAPRLARRLPNGDFGPEDPCAYEAAEMIRERFIGAIVDFQEDYFVEAAQRSAGRLAAVKDGNDAGALLLLAGYATVNERLPAHMDKELHGLYLQAMQHAKTLKRGIFAPDAKKHVRVLRNTSSAEQTALGEKLQGQTVQARVERVLSPTTLVVSSSAFGPTQIVVHLTGINAKDTDASLQSAAKINTEVYLLNRNVSLRIDGVDKFGNVLASVMGKDGNAACFQEQLLARGFVRLQAATLIHAPRVKAMEEAEEAAKAARAGTWVDYVPPAPEEEEEEAAEGEEQEEQEEEQDEETAAGDEGDGAADGGVAKGSKRTTKGGAAKAGAAVPVVNVPAGETAPTYSGPAHFTGTLVQVVHGDTVMVRRDKDGEYVRLSLAGIKTSKNINRGARGQTDVPVVYREYAFEARELLRSKFIGAAVEVLVEFARIMPETKELRPSATITTVDTGANLAAAVLEAGYATFFLGRNDRCEAAATLQAADEAAREQKRGLHSDTPAREVVIKELNRLGEAGGKRYLSFLQRGMQGGRPPVLKGVVDMVIGPSSFRVYIPKEHMQVPIKIAGIITPSIAFNKDEKADPFADEAKDLAVRTFQQRDVNVQVFSSDRGGNFLGSVSLADGTNASVVLVAAGLATVGNTARLPFAQQLEEAQAAARRKKLYIWSEDGALPQRAAKQEAERAAAGQPPIARITDESAATSKPYMITEVADDARSVYLQTFGEKADATKAEIQRLLNAAAALPAPSASAGAAKKGEVLMALYDDDGTWYRARQVQAQRATVKVQFIDFGNTEEVPQQNVRPVPAGAEYAVVRDTPPFAQHAYLAFLKQTSPEPYYNDEAADSLAEFMEGEVHAKPLYKDEAGRVYYTITSDANVPSLSEMLLQGGLAVLDRRLATVLPEEYRRHEAAQEIARKGHKALWRYGDIDESDEDDRMY